MPQAKCLHDCLSWWLPSSSMQSGLGRLAEAARTIDELSQQAEVQRSLLARKQDEADQAMSDIQVITVMHVSAELGACLLGVSMTRVVTITWAGGRSLKLVGVILLFMPASSVASACRLKPWLFLCACLPQTRHRWKWQLTGGGRWNCCGSSWETARRSSRDSGVSRAGSWPSHTPEAATWWHVSRCGCALPCKCTS